MKRFYAMALCLSILFSGCTSRLQQAQSAERISTAASSLEEPNDTPLTTTTQGSSFPAIPSEIDPAGFLSSPDSYLKSVQNNAEVYNEAYVSWPILYELPSTYLCGEEAPSIIQIESGKVKQIATAAPFNEAYDDVYEQLCGLLGNPDRFYEVDFDNIKTSLADYRPYPNKTSVQWKRNGYYIEMRVFGAQDIFCIATYRDTLDPYQVYWYDSAETQCGITRDTPFIGYSIYTDADIFSLDGNKAMEEYAAQPMKLAGKHCMNGSLVQTYTMTLEGLSVLGWDMKLEFFGLAPEQYVIGGGYRIDVTGHDPEDIQLLYKTIYEALDTSLDTDAQDLRPAIEDLRFFDPSSQFFKDSRTVHNWHIENEMPHTMYISLEAPYQGQYDKEMPLYIEWGWHY